MYFTKYTLLYVQFIHFVMMMVIGDWDIRYILISTGYVKPGRFTSQGLKQTFSLIPVFVGSLLLKSALDCRLSKFKHEKIILNSAWTSEFHQGLWEERYASIRSAQKNYIKQWHLWPLPRVEFQRCNNAQGFCRFKSLLTLSMAYFQALLPPSIYAPPVLLMLTLLFISTLHTSICLLSGYCSPF